MSTPAVSAANPTPSAPTSSGPAPNSTNAAPATPSSSSPTGAPSTNADGKSAPSSPAKMDPSEAARILANAKARIGSKPGRTPAKTEPTVGAQSSKDATPGAGPSPSNGKSDPSPEKATTSSSTDDKPADKPSPEDEAAQYLARNVQESRRLASERQKLDADRKEIETFKTQRETWEKDPEVVAFRAAKAAAAKGDRVGAFRALYGDVSDDDFWAFITHVAGSKPDGKGEGKPGAGAAPMTPEEIERVVEAKVAAKLEADRKAKEDADKAKADAGRKEYETVRDVYVNACAETFKAQVKEFPLINKKGLAPGTIEQYLHTYAKANTKPGQLPAVPEPVEVLRHFEKVYADEVRELAQQMGLTAPATVGGTDTGRTVTDETTRDSGGRTTADGKAKKPTVDEKRAQAKARLREMNGRTA